MTIRSNDPKWKVAAGEGETPDDVDVASLQKRLALYKKLQAAVVQVWDSEEAAEKVAMELRREGLRHYVPVDYRQNVIAIRGSLEKWQQEIRLTIQALEQELR